MKKLRKYGKNVFGVAIVVCTLLTCGITVMAQTISKDVSKDGVTMHFSLNQNNNTWAAETSCYEDMGSMVSLYIYKTENGTLLKSNCKKVHTRTVAPGSSVTYTIAKLGFNSSTAKYGRSSHALLWLNTNQPFISALELEKTR